MTPEAAIIVRDVLVYPDGTDPCKHLKEEIIKRCSESKEQEIRHLLTGEQSDCSIIPASRHQKKMRPVQAFQAANGLPIEVYGKKLLSLELDLRR
ncbi:hypothetical protein AVEN_190804-1 [Araneus ventricosus]|uniref:DUF7041 domain-containing protein n=1 Tax=Araneus ventricosus TaxID=182803 RepID=A0A4Y2DZG7_ARAVE|nr:hypothetical protein AVEN_190804-1 [Araneus ventricosus]